WYNIVTFLTAFLLAKLASQYSPKWVHIICLLLAATGFLFFPWLSNKYLLIVAITGFGIGWASMMGIPYLMVVSEIPKERYGVYMGIINMMIVLPMILQNVTFGYILEHFLHNDSRLAITFAGVLLILAAIATALITVKKGEKVNTILPTSH
ncbi:MAG TPA: MFS transporter, partial [Saprospiraceae bacterium]|nr:MFS transporter [Saprospiraceae bacterium]